jgi:pectate lyase
MRNHYFIIPFILFTLGANGQNKVDLTLTDGNVISYRTDSIASIDFDGNKVTVCPSAGNSIIYNGNISLIGFHKTVAGAVVIKEVKGWQESAYAKWNLLDGASDYHVYIKGGIYNDYTQIDKELVRLYSTYGRADIVGLKAGSYQIRIIPIINGNEDASKAANSSPLEITNYDRSGFAFLKYSGVGAYKDDGTLKDNAVVVYVNSNNAKTVTAKLSSGTFTGLQAILTAYQKGNVTNPLDIRILGLIKNGDTDTFGSSSEGIQIKGKNADNVLNITIEGIGDDATIKGFGFLIRNSKSVEMRNFAVMRQMDDGISLDTNNSNIWIHNIDLFYGKAGSGDHIKGDGSIDVKTDSKYITIDYCHFWDSGKTSLCGMKSESGPNYITYHHNWFDHSDSRHARVRTMSVHIYNNYFDGNSKYGIGATTGSSIFAENNYFRDCHDPMLISQQGTDAKGKGTFSGETGGIIKGYGNIFAEKGNSSNYTPVSYFSDNTNFDYYDAKTRNEKVPDNVVTLSGGTHYNNFDTNSSLMYDYAPDAAEDVPARITGYYGAGRLNHGNLQYAFTSSIDDNSSDVNATLANMIDNYNGSSE